MLKTDLKQKLKTQASKLIVRCKTFNFTKIRKKYNKNRKMCESPKR